ncbi:MAG: phospho-sugar mutase [Lachnospiraceae bacterium]|nr:phospho-sugar mutase [Lachnospiraceae bacterium]
MNDYLKEYNYWLNNETFDADTVKELEGIKNDENEIKDRFIKNLEFGTGGLRGVIGAGTNRMNIYTVRKASQGLADVINFKGGAERGVAIAYDSRHMSVEFSREAALTLNANGIKTYRFESLRPTPELSFALRTLGCIAGIVVTASHNPPEYNGYKVYWEDGAQITAPLDDEIISRVNSITDFSLLKTMDIEEAEKKGLYNTIGKEIDDKYIDTLEKLVLRPDAIKAASDMKIVYTPLHGTGLMPVKRILERLGFKNVYVVPEQEKPDGDFPTVGYPNPEDQNVYKLALGLAKKVDADLILATDPDADRLGVYAKDSRTGEYVPFTGNMSGTLLCEYELSTRKELGLLPDNGAVVKTIVSSNMCDRVVEAYGCDLIEVLTGFKFIGEQIKYFEQGKKNNTYLFGYEESYGCLIGTHARDKDAVVAVMGLCEAASYYRTKGMTLYDKMLDMYEKYGYYMEGAVSVTMKGVDGAEKIKAILNGLREKPLSSLADTKVIESRDYLNNICVNTASGEKKPTGLPKSNVLYYVLENDQWCCVRPSGTEPKIKFYFGIRGKNMEDAKVLYEKFDREIRKLSE